MPKYRHRPEHQPTEVFPVFSIETYEIYADVWIQLLVSLQLAGYLQHDGYSAGAIVGSHYRLAPVGTVGVVVSPRTAVPMSTEQDAGFSLRVVMGDDIGILQDGTIIALEVSLKVSTSQPNCLNLLTIHSPHLSCASLFMTRGPKSHCAAQ